MELSGVSARDQSALYEAGAEVGGSLLGTPGITLWSIDAAADELLREALRRKENVYSLDADRYGHERAVLHAAVRERVQAIFMKIGALGPEEDILFDISEDVRQHPMFQKIQTQLETRSVQVFPEGKKPSFHHVASRLSPEIMDLIASLEDQKLYGMNEEGELIWGDGGDNVPDFTRGLNHIEALTAAEEKGLDLMTTSEASNLTADLHFEKKIEGEAIQYTWLKSGERATSLEGMVFPLRGDPTEKVRRIGTRRVVRLKL